MNTQVEHFYIVTYQSCLLVFAKPWRRVHGSLSVRLLRRFTSRRFSRLLHRSLLVFLVCGSFVGAAAALREHFLSACWFVQAECCKYSSDRACRAQLLKFWSSTRMVSFHLKRRNARL